MKRSTLITALVDFEKSIPEEASDYHRIDSLISYLSGMVHIIPPTNESGYRAFDEELED